VVLVTVFSCRQTGTHYADGLEGCSRSSILAVRQSFAELFRFLLRSLAGQEEGTNVSREAEQLKFHTLVLNALALDYRMFDYALFSNSDFHAVLHKLSTHDVALRQEPSLSSSSSRSSTAHPASEAVAASKLRAHKKRVVRVARNLFLLSAARCLAWTPTPLALRNNHLGEDEAQQILDLQDAVLRTIFFTELGSHRREEEAASEARRSTDLDDDYHHALLALLYQLKRTATMQRFFSSSESIHNVLSLLKLGSPRVQRLVTRLCRHVVHHMQPGRFVKTSSKGSMSADEVVEFFIDLLGSLISGSYVAVPSDAMTTTGAEMSAHSASSLSRTSSSESVSGRHCYSLILHRPQGVTISDVLRMLPQSQLTATGESGLDVNLKEVVRELKAIDQTVVLRDSSIEKCRRYASLLAAKGFSVTIARQDPVPKKNTEPEPATGSSSQFYMWRSRRVDYSLASEIVSFLRTLLIAPDWQSLLSEKLRTNMSALSALVQSLGQRIAASAKAKAKAAGASAEEGSQNAELAGQQRIMAVLAVLGGWNEDLRVGGKVRLRGEARPDNAGESTSASVGTVISFLSPSTVKVRWHSNDTSQGILAQTMLTPSRIWLVTGPVACHGQRRAGTADADLRGRRAHTRYRD